MGGSGGASTLQAKASPSQADDLVGVPKKYHRAIELARKDLTLTRWEYFVDPFPGPVRRWLTSLLCDPRDYPMVVLLSNLLCTTVVMVAVQTQLEPGSRLAHAVGVAYSVMQLVLWEARFILCLHYSAHLKLFSPEKAGRLAAGALNEILPTAIAPLFGIPSGMYFLHHVAMHHVEDNIFPMDLSSTMPYQRDSFLDFLKYWATYLTLTMFYLPAYALYKGRPRLAFYAITLLTCWASGMYYAWTLHSTAAFYTLIFPFLFASLALMFGNFSQHIFVEPSRPADDYCSTYNCLNVLDNRFTFNDGYHIVHHLNARKHWSEMPQNFIDNVAKYEEHGAILFEGLFFFQVGVMVMTGQWKALARHVVQVRDDPLSEAELIALMKRRVQKIPHKWD
mmetsp:Transcript_23388/g.72883  ORF Transcript_23388/g.72883 Transcript_23388/m.72883 type:complete len:393 (+) Transcript_23388:173-1351(+)